MPSTTYLADRLAPEGPLTSLRPTGDQKKDMEFGFRTAESHCGPGFGSDGLREGPSGFGHRSNGRHRRLYSTSGAFAGFTVAKAKPRQDIRFNVPVIGIRTLESLKAAGAAVLAVEAGKTLLFDKDEFLKGAQEAKIVVIGVKG